MSYIAIYISLYTYNIHYNIHIISSVFTASNFTHFPWQVTSTRDSLVDPGVVKGNPKSDARVRTKKRNKRTVHRKMISFPEFVTTSNNIPAQISRYRNEGEDGVASFCFCLIQHLSHDLLANKKWINGTNNNINNGVPGTNTGNMGIQQKWDLIEQKWDITRNDIINPTSDAHFWTAQTYHRQVHFNRYCIVRLFEWLESEKNKSKQMQRPSTHLHPCSM